MIYPGDRNTFTFMFSGYPPNTTVEFYFVAQIGSSHLSNSPYSYITGPQATFDSKGTITSTAPIITLIKTVNIDSNGAAVYVHTNEEPGDDGIVIPRTIVYNWGRDMSAGINSNIVSVDFKSANPTVTFSTNKSIVKAGDTYRLSTTLRSGRPNAAYTINIMERGGAFGSRIKNSRTITTDSSGGGSDYLDVYYDGSSAYSGTVFMWTELSGVKSNEISVTFTPNSTPAPTPAPTSAPPPTSNFRAVFSTYLGAPDRSSPHTEVPTSQRMGIVLDVYNRGYGVGVGVLNSKGTDWSGSLSATYAMAIGVFPKSRVNIQLEVLDASGTIVLARSTGSNVDTNGDTIGYVNTNGHTGIPANVLADGMNYIVRIVATNVNTGEVTRSGNYSAYCFSGPAGQGLGGG